MTSADSTANVQNTQEMTEGSSLTNADFRKLLMTPGSKDQKKRSGGRESKHKKPDKTKTKYQSSTSQKHKSKTHGIKDDVYSKHSSSRYRDRAKERRENVNQETDTHSIQQTSTGVYRTVGPSIQSNADAATRRRKMIEESKFLGGDINHTHLVKGLDYALLQKIRDELTNKEMKNELDEEYIDDENDCKTVKCPMAQNICQALFEPKQVVKKTDKYKNNRMAYIIDLESAYSDIPTTLLRSKADCQDTQQKSNGSANDFVIQKLSEILWALRNGEKDLIKKAKRPRKEPERNPILSQPIYEVDELSAMATDTASNLPKAPLFNSSINNRSTANKRQYFDYIANSSKKEYEIPKFEKSTKAKQKVDNSTESYAECYPGTAAEEDVNIDSEDEPDYTKMDSGSRKTHAGRREFDTHEEYATYMSNREALPKAAFQYGVKMVDGRKTKKTHGHLDDKKKFDREWQQITKILVEKKKGDIGF